MIEETYFQIHREYFEKLKNKMHEDVKRIVDMLLSGREKKACHMFSHRFRELWACFEKEDREGHFRDLFERDNYLKNSEDKNTHFEYSLEKLPYNAVFNESKDSNRFDGPSRPKMSGWLTELFVYYFVSELLKRKRLEEKYKALNSRKIGEKYIPDVSIVSKEGIVKINSETLPDDPKVVKAVIEVKTVIPDKRDVESIQKKKKYYEEIGIRYFLFVGETSSKSKIRVHPVKRSVVRELEKQDELRSWIYFPYEEKLGNIVKEILESL